MESIGAVNGSQLPVSQKGGTNADSSISIDNFFQLIAAQLQNQSMYDSVDNTQFMTQMVQFTTLSQMNELNATFQSSLAVSLIGKPVSIVTTNAQGGQESVTGEVEQVSFNEGKPYLMVNGGFYQMSEVTDIGAWAPSKPSPTSPVEETTAAPVGGANTTTDNAAAMGLYAQMTGTYRREDSDAD